MSTKFNLWYFGRSSQEHEYILSNNAECYLLCRTVLPLVTPVPRTPQDCKSKGNRLITLLRVQLITFGARSRPRLRELLCQNIDRIDEIAWHHTSCPATNRIAPCSNPAGLNTHPTLWHSTRITIGSLIVTAVSRYADSQWNDSIPETGSSQRNALLIVHVVRFPISYVHLRWN